MKTSVWAWVMCGLALHASAETLPPVFNSSISSGSGSHAGKPNRPYPDRPRPPPRPHPRPPHPVPPYYPYYPVYPSQTVVVQQPMEPVAIESLRVGDRMPPDYRYSDYAIEDYRGHGLNKPASHQRWALIAGQYYLYDLKSWQIKSIVRQ